jgi:glyoxylase-like metal-dependent hydrolase (beta-lactamase superfamily II)
MTVQKVNKRSFVLTFDSIPEWDLNVHIIQAERRTFVIDTGLGSESMKPVIEYLRPGKPVVVVNTHFHWDHVWGNAVFEGSIIVSHRLCRERLERDWGDMLQKNSRYISGAVEQRLPDVVFDGMLCFPEDGIRLFHTPGHTEDGISVLDERDGVLNAGDNIGDDPEHIVPELECGKDVYIASLNQYIESGADTVISGHNAVQKRDIFGKILKAL